MTEKQTENFALRMRSHQNVESRDQDAFDSECVVRGWFLGAESVRKLRSLTPHHLPPMSHEDTKTRYFCLGQSEGYGNRQVRHEVTCLRILNSHRDVCSACLIIPACVGFIFALYASFYGLVLS
jgi:hypothetical protein